MQAPKSLPPPTNWQDFESLCKVLWTEIWRHPETKKNGRSGQNQHGVDVYGVPYWETGQYYGIQCKGKDIYTDKQFTQEEINKEIEKAKLFQPPLKKLYFTTTAVKDAKIEEFIRLKNTEHIKAGLFEVHIYSWEDIVDLIYENKGTYDWYVKSQNFKTDRNASVTFQDGSTELIIRPKFYKRVNEYTTGNIRTALGMNTFQKHEDLFQGVSSTHINHSFSMFKLKIHNIGTESIEDYKLPFTFEGKVQDIANTNFKYSGISGISPFNHRIHDTSLDRKSMSGKVIPNSNILVGEDTYNSDEIFIKPLPENCTITLNWKLISKHYTIKGVLTLIVKPEIEKKFNDIIVKDKSEARTEIIGIEDCIKPKLSTKEL